MKTGAQLISEERERQIMGEGWSSENDDSYKERELSSAALSYLEHYCDSAWMIRDELGRGTSLSDYVKGDPPFQWPWDAAWWKPKGEMQDLIRAGALIAAEIDRLQREKERISQAS